MKKFLYIIIGLFILCSSTESYGQLFSKRKKGYASPKKGNTDSARKRDAFSRKNRRKPNIESSGRPKKGSKSSRYQHSVSKKEKKKRSVFSSRKKNHKSVVSANRKKSDDSSKNSSVGRKSRKGRNRK